MHVLHFSLKRVFIFFSLIFLLNIAGCYSVTPKIIQNEKEKNQTIPNIKIVIDCGDCKIPDSVLIGIAQSYVSAANQQGRKLSTEQEAILTIQEYSARNDMARFFFGALAGKEEIKAKLSYQNKQSPIEANYNHAFLDINAVAREIGRLSFEKIDE